MRIAMIALDLYRTGITSVILNYCKAIDKKNCIIDVIVGDRVIEEYKEELEEVGINVIVITFKHDNMLKYFIQLWKVLAHGKYDIAHIHGNSAMIIPELLIAKLNKIKVRIAHSHNTQCDHMLLNKMLKPIFNVLYTHGFACSSIAGRWMFENRPFQMIFNGFDVERFRFNNAYRAEIRKELEIENCYVIGHIGRFNEQKNHSFLLRVFEKVADDNQDAVLLLIGGGPDIDDVISKINNHPYKDRIIVYGETSEPEKMYAAMDKFVLPSKYEGLGIVLLEAQINGLTCVASTAVPEEANLAGRMKRISLEDDVNKWKNALTEADFVDRDLFFQGNESEIYKYDIKQNAIRLKNFYCQYISVQD